MRRHNGHRSRRRLACLQGWLVLVLVLLTAQSAPRAQETDCTAITSEANSQISAVLEATVTAEQRAEAAGVFSAASDCWDQMSTAEVFPQLSPQHQQQILGHRALWALWGAEQLVALGSCEEALTLIESVMNNPGSDEERTAALRETYREAGECVEASERPTVTVVGAPENAELLLDGTSVGAPPNQYPVSLGGHIAVVRADGYEEWRLEFSATEPGAEIVLEVGMNPRVIPPPPDEPSAMPEWYEWTLWGVGGAGIATAVGLYADARRLEGQLSDPPPGWEVRDSEREQERIDSRDLGAYIAGGVGVACIAIGTVLFLVRRADDDDPTESEAVIGPWLTGDAFGMAAKWTFR